MSSWGSFDFSEFKRFQQKVDKLCQNDLDAFCRDCARELAARLLGKVIRRTPVGVYTGGKVGGTLRRGWTGGKSAGAEYAKSLSVSKQGNDYVIEVINPTDYASYVEFGHRTRGGKGWIDGRFMLTISENELKSQAPQILERKLDELLRQVFS